MPDSPGSSRQENAPGAAPDATAPVEEAPEQVLITGGLRTVLIGQATTSSQGIVLKEELNQLPVFRTGQLLETVPGLTVTSHSGEGKANQYLMRGFNLDHGTDLAIFMEGMPVNMRTHAHGQGYSDLNFFIPELATGIEYTKGAYFAQQGDFAGVASVRIGYLDEIANQATATVGTLGYQRLFTAGTFDLMNGRILGGLELVHYDGPWTHPDNARKLNAVLRYSQGEATEGWSLTGMYYRGLWNATTDQPERATDPVYMASLGATPIGRFGTLDPSDAGQAQRMSVSGVYSHGTLNWHVDANAYVINNNLTLWNDFTHFLFDPIHGDQYAQNDIRTLFGGGASYTRYGMLFGGNTETMVGLQGRYDDIHVNHIHTQDRVPLVGGIFAEDDKVTEGSTAVYAQYTDYVAEWFRFILGAREDYFDAADKGTNAASQSVTLFQPKASLVLTPITNWEFYISAGRGFHSNDFRGIASGGEFLSPITSYEAGMRMSPLQDMTATITLFQMELRSELTYAADIGQTSPGRPSRRTGVEINLAYFPFDWLEFYGSAAFTHSRYSDSDPAGRFIPDAPNIISQIGIYVRDAGPWFGALEFRFLGPHPLIENNSVTSNGDQEWNMNIGYNFGGGFKGQLGIFNLFDSKDNAAEYYYADRVTPTETLVSPDGNPDLHIHPLEQRTFRFTLTKTF